MSFKYHVALYRAPYKYDAATLYIYRMDPEGGYVDTRTLIFDEEMAVAEGSPWRKVNDGDAVQPECCITFGKSELENIVRDIRSTGLLPNAQEEIDRLRKELEFTNLKLDAAKELNAVYTNLLSRNISVSM